MTNFEKMCAEGKPIFLSYDQTEMIRRVSLRSDEDWLYPVYLGEELRLNRRSGDLFYADGREAEGSVLLSVFDFLCRKSDPRPLTGRMFPSGSLPGYGTSRPDDIGLHAKHALALSGRLEPLRTLLRSMGGEDFPVGDAAARFELFPGFPLIFQFWEGDEEFPPSVRFLWDERTSDYLRFETLFYIMGDFLRRVLECLPSRKEPLP